MGEGILGIPPDPHAAQHPVGIDGKGWFCGVWLQPQVEPPLGCSAPHKPLGCRWGPADAPHLRSIPCPYSSALQRILPPAGITPKSGNTPILKCPTDFPLILWHPYARHYYFCLMTGKEQEKWGAVFQDCVRHCNNGERGAPRWGEHCGVLGAPRSSLLTYRGRYGDEEVGIGQQ